MQVVSTGEESRLSVEGDAGASDPEAAVADIGVRPLDDLWADCERIDLDVGWF
jgi:hypothetical protein